MANLNRTHSLSPGTWVAVVLSAVGAINWGLIGLFAFNLVGSIFGDGTRTSRIIYVLVGISGVYLLVQAATGFRSGSDEHTAGRGRHVPT